MSVRHKYRSIITLQLLISHCFSSVHYSDTETVRVTPLGRTLAPFLQSDCTSCCQQWHVLQAVKLCSYKILQFINGGVG